MPKCVTGKVAEIGPNGSLITCIQQTQVADAPRDERISIAFGGHQTVGLFDDPHEQPESTMVAKLNSEGFVEIEIVGLSLSEMLGIKVDEKVTISWP
ncbi:MAG: adenosylmethionine-8-amino-7-oxononanoate aminotransferase [Mariniblastus sp.]|nr:adenosylmethionine-8-amino-7-oxononanoate aminotransferase [Mariniblastus sp.]